MPCGVGFLDERIRENLAVNANLFYFYQIEDAYSKKVTLDGKTYIIEVLDTADKVSVFH